MESSIGLKISRVERFVDNLVYDVAQLQSISLRMIQQYHNENIVSEVPN